MWNDENGIGGISVGIITAISRTIIGSTGIISAIMSWIGG